MIREMTGCGFWKGFNSLQYCHAHLMLFAKDSEKTGITAAKQNDASVAELDQVLRSLNSEDPKSMILLCSGWEYSKVSDFF